MKKTIFTFAMITALGAFTFASINSNDISTSTEIACEGEHKCDDKCKKDDNGKCAEAKGEKGEAKSCCSKDKKKSCHGKKAKSNDKSSEETDVKS